MKKFYVAALLLFSISMAFSQEEKEISTIDQRETGQNELSINAFNLVAFGIVDVAYERVISENSTWAIEGFYYPSKNQEFNDDAYYKRLSLTGKYKHFFSSTFARGFYVNGFGMLSSGDYDTEYVFDYSNDSYYYESEDYTDFAIGFGLGGKFVSPGGFLLDLNGGIGRNLFSSNSPEIIGQFMVNLGYRF